MLYMFKNGLLGQSEVGQTLYFSGSDTEIRYLQKLKNKPIDWYYRTNHITYTYNDYGHRCKNVSAINLENYILFAGDSHTEGIGCELEKTYPFLTSNNLGIDYYNLGLGSTGLDAMFSNIVNWLNLYPKPKLICLFWSGETRFLQLIDHNINYNLTSVGPNFTKSLAEEHAITYGEIAGLFKTRYLIFAKTLENIFNKNNIKYVNISNLQTHTEFNINNDLMTIPKFYTQFNNIRTSDGRDDIHFGNGTHKFISDWLVENYDRISHCKII